MTLLIQHSKLYILCHILHLPATASSLNDNYTYDLQNLSDGTRGGRIGKVHVMQDVTSNPDRVKTTSLKIDLCNYINLLLALIG